MKSVRGLGLLSIVVLVGSGLAALLGFIGLAICLAAASVILVLGLIRALERRRHAAHRQIVRSLASIKRQLAANNDALLLQHKQHANSLELSLQELRALSLELTGDDPLLEGYAERQLATYLHALRITKRELLEAAAGEPKAANTKMEKR